MSEQWDFQGRWHGIVDVDKAPTSVGVEWLVVPWVVCLCLCEEGVCSVYMNNNNNRCIEIGKPFEEEEMKWSEVNECVSIPWALSVVREKRVYILHTTSWSEEVTTREVCGVLHPFSNAPITPSPIEPTTTIHAFSLIHSYSYNTLYKCMCVWECVYMQERSRQKDNVLQKKQVCKSVKNNVLHIHMCACGMHVISLTHTRNAYTYIYQYVFMCHVWVIQQHHGILLVGHFEVRKTLELVSRIYWWS